MISFFKSEAKWKERGNWHETSLLGPKSSRVTHIISHAKPDLRLTRSMLMMIKTLALTRKFKQDNY